jgi:5-methylcytosine-specific restriction endonuclease McrA
MTTATLVEAHVTDIRPGAIAAATHSPNEDLGERIAALAARLHAATYELLVLLREFDHRCGWNTGFLSCAHWLHWRTGIDLGAAREKVRVAHALAVLPRISATMQRGAISYAKVRALTRVATPDNEVSLLDFALAGTAAQTERLVRAWRRINDVTAAAQEESRHLHRQLSTWVDDDGMVVIRGRLTPDVGAIVQRALEAAADRLFREAQGAPRAERVADEVTPAQRRADALGLLAESALTSDLDRGSAGDRYQVVLHVEASSRGAAEQGLSGTLELDHGAVDVSAETSRRICCDASVVAMRHDTDGAVLGVGRKIRTIPPSIRRALQARDRSCRFPGCTARRCDAHHIDHWADGGATSLDNLVLLCRRHHRAVHEGGFDPVQHGDRATTFLHPDRTVIEAAPPLPVLSTQIGAAFERLDDIAVWDGTPFDLAYALDVLYAPPTPTEM